MQGQAIFKGQEGFADHLISDEVQAGVDEDQPLAREMFSRRLAGETTPESYEIRPDARRFETWEGSIAGKIGLGVAVDYAMAVGLDSIRERCGKLADQLRRQLAGADGVSVHDIGVDKAAIVSFSKQGIDARRLADRLSVQRINVSVSDRGSTLLDMQERGLDDIVRASPHYYNTEEEVERLVAAIRD